MVEGGGFRLVEEKTPEGFVFPVIECQGHDFIHRNDLTVAERDGVEAAKLLEGRLETQPGLAAVIQ